MNLEQRISRLEETIDIVKLNESEKDIFSLEEYNKTTQMFYKGRMKSFERANKYVRLFQKDYPGLIKAVGLVDYANNYNPLGDRSGVLMIKWSKLPFENEEEFREVYPRLEGRVKFGRPSKNVSLGGDNVRLGKFNFSMYI